MKTKIIPFVEKFLYSLIVIFIGIPATVGWLYLLSLDENIGRGISLPTSAHWVAFWVCLLVIVLIIFLSTCFSEITIENDFVCVGSFELPRTLKKGAYNIDSLWNNEIYLSEVKNIKIVKLTKDERRTKVFCRHLFNKYLKIDLKYGKTKYVYVGNYTESQINRIVHLLTYNR